MTDAYWAVFRRRHSRRGVLKALGGAGVALVGAACSPGAAPAPPTVAAVAGGQAPATGTGPATPPTAVAAKRGGTFRWGGPNTWPHLDPHQTTNVVIVGYGVGVCYSKLLKLKLKGVQMPAALPTGDLAESWEQPDDVTYVFKLRPNVKWQNVAPLNGRALTADDIIYSYDRQRTKGFANAGLLEAITKMEAVDRNTLKLTTRAPSADFLIALTDTRSVIVAKEAVELKGDLKEGPLVGTGPFIVEKLDKNGLSVLRRNPDFYIAGQPYIDTYHYIITPDYQTTVSAFRAGDLEVIPQPNISVEEANGLKKANPNIQVILDKSFTGSQLGLNLKRPPFNDVRVRQAFYKAIDTKALIATAGAGWLSVGWNVPSLDWTLPPDEIGRLVQQDVEGARRLLREAGQDKGFDFTFTVSNGIPQDVSGAELIAAQLKDVGIRTTIKTVDYSTLQEQLTRKDFDAYIGAYGTGGTFDLTVSQFYYGKGPLNVAGVEDPTLDQMIDKQTTLGRDPEARRKMVLDIQRRVIDQGYPRAIYAREAPTTLQPYVRDYVAHTVEYDRFVLSWLDK
jgi:peptide/nickel transport system substrate-binding protein